MRDYSLVDVMHHLHDKLGVAFCFKKNAINKKVPLKIYWVAPVNYIHPRKAAMIAIANEELQVLQEAQFTTRVEVTHEHFVLLSLDWIPHTHLLLAELLALSFLIRGGDIEDRRSITVSPYKFLLQLSNVAG